MADRYVYSGAAGAGTGVDWANAFTTVSAAITAGAAGDQYFIAHDHAETQASALTITAKGSVTLPDRFICVDRLGSVPPVAADVRKTATITTTGANGITLSGTAAFAYGITFNSGSSVGAGSWNLDGCQINLSTAGSTASITSGSVRWSDTTLVFGNVGQSISRGNASHGSIRWSNSPTVPAVSGVIPTSLFTFSGTNRLLAELDGLDLSAIGSGKTIVGTGTASVKLINCKLNGSVTVAATPNSLTSEAIEVIGCSSGGSVRRDERYDYQGTLTTETTIVRNNGASDGVTPFSWKVVPTLNNERDFPFGTFEGVLWNDAVGVAKTLTIRTLTEGITLTDAEVWLEVDYLGSSAAPVAYHVTDGPATPLSVGVAQDASTHEWNTTGIASPIKQKLNVTFTPQMAGPIRWKVRIARAATNPIYICPKAELS